MLVGAFEIQIRRIPLPGLEHSGITHTGLEPHVQNVAFLFKFRSAAAFALSPGRQQRGSLVGKPIVGPMLADQIGDMIDHPRMR